MPAPLNSMMNSFLTWGSEMTQSTAEQVRQIEMTRTGVLFPCGVSAQEVENKPQSNSMCSGRRHHGNWLTRKQLLTLSQCFRYLWSHPAGGCGPWGNSSDIVRNYGKNRSHFKYCLSPILIHCVTFYSPWHFDQEGKTFTIYGVLFASSTQEQCLPVIWHTQSV